MRLSQETWRSPPAPRSLDAATVALVVAVALALLAAAVAGLVAAGPG